MRALLRNSWNWRNTLGLISCLVLKADGWSQAIKANEEPTKLEKLVVLALTDDAIGAPVWKRTVLPFFQAVRMAMLNWLSPLNPK